MKNVLRLFNDKRNLVIILLLTLTTIKFLQQKEALFILWMFLGASICVGFNALIQKFLKKQTVVDKSAFITGIIVSGIIDYGQNWYVLLVFSLVAILSKYIIKYEGKHLFNPANFALFLATIFQIPLTWNIESNIILIILMGMYLAYSLKKLPHVIGFVIIFSSCVFLFERINPLHLVSWFFVFIMLIEPKTSGFGTLRGIVFGSTAGLASFLCYKYAPSVDIFVTGLFVANLSNLFPRRHRDNRQDC